MWVLFVNQSKRREDLHSKKSEKRLKGLFSFKSDMIVMDRRVSTNILANLNPVFSPIKLDL